MERGPGNLLQGYGSGKRCALHNFASLQDLQKWANLLRVAHYYVEVFSTGRRDVPIIKDLQAKLVELLQPYHPARIEIFGSYARGENKIGSDLDILIKFRDRISLLKLVQIEQELHDELGIPIDLVTENSLKNPRLKKYIEKDLITIYE